MHKNKITLWLASEQLSQVNGLLFDDGYLVVGNSGKNLLQKINVDTKEIKTITCLGSGVIDGIKKYDDESCLVSLWRGELLRVKHNGELESRLHAENKFNIADFDFDQEKGLLFIPTFLGKNIACYQINN